MIVSNLNAQVANQPTPFELCDDNYDGFATFDLTVKDAEILGGQDPIAYSVTYHETVTDADNGINALVSPYGNILNPQTIFVRVEDVNSGSFDTTTLILRVLPNPSPGTPSIIELCDDASNDGFAVFDLTLNELIIINGEVGNTVSYFESFSDATFNSNAIVDPSMYSNITTSFQTIYARLENDSTGCFAITEFDIIVNPYPVAPGLEESYVFCEGESLIIDSGVDPTLYAIAWYFDGFIIPDADSSTLTVNQAGTYSFSCISYATDCASLVNIVVIVVSCDDSDNDGVIDSEEDRNGNGNLEDDDTDFDSIPNYLDVDDDGDNIDTSIEINITTGRMPNHPFVDTDGDLIENYLDNDDDEDGVLTIDEDYNNNGDPTDDDTDMSGTADYLEANVALSIDEVELNSFELIPNPAKHVLMIQLNTMSVGKSSISIFDIQGKLVLEQNLLDGNRMNIDVSGFHSGLYFVEVNSNDKSMIEKLIVE